MKMKHFVKSGCIFFLITLVFFFVACYDFEFVIQPDIAQLNSTFEVQIGVSIDSLEEGGIPHFGILLPVGWSVKDSIKYIGDVNGMFVFSQIMSDSLEILEPSLPGYYWW